MIKRNLADGDQLKLILNEEMKTVNVTTAMCCQPKP